MKWIKVEDKEKLPTELEDVLFTDGEGVYKGYRQSSSLDETDYWYSIAGSQIEGVTHWMYLPEPPKE